MLDKNKNWWDCMSSSKLENDTPFLSLAAIIATRDGWDGTDFHIRNRMVCAVEMSGYRLVNIVVPYETKMLGKSVRETSAQFLRCKVWNIYYMIRNKWCWKRCRWNYARQWNYDWVHKWRYFDWEKDVCNSGLENKKKCRLVMMNFVS